MKRRIGPNCRHGRQPAALGAEQADGQDGVERGSRFADEMAHNGQLYGDNDSFFRHDVCEQEDGADTDDLFGQLGECRNFRFLHTIIVAVNTCMDGGTWNGYGDKRKQRGTPLFQKDSGSEKIRQMPDERSQDSGHGKGDDQSGQENGFPLLHVCGYGLGYGCLNGAGAESKADSEHRMYHVVKSQAFRPDGAGQENPVEEAQDAAEKAGGCQQKCAC